MTDEEIFRKLISDAEVEEMRERLWKKLEPAIVSALKKRRESQEKSN